MSRVTLIVLDSVGVGALPTPPRSATRGSSPSATSRSMRKKTWAAFASPTCAPSASITSTASGLRGWTPPARTTASAGVRPRQGHHHRPLRDERPARGKAEQDFSGRLPQADHRRIGKAHRRGGDRQLPRLRHRDHPGARRGAYAHRPPDHLHLGGQPYADRHARADYPPRTAVRDAAASPASC